MTSRELWEAIARCEQEVFDDHLSFESLRPILAEALGEDDDINHPRRRKLTRQERLEALADRGIDTWEEYRSER